MKKYINKKNIIMVILIIILVLIGIILKNTLFKPNITLEIKKPTYLVEDYDEDLKKIYLIKETQYFTILPKVSWISTKNLNLVIENKDVLTYSDVTKSVYAKKSGTSYIYYQTKDKKYTSNKIKVKVYGLESGI